VRASSFLFNDFTFLPVPHKWLKFHSSLFSIPTAPTKAYCFQLVGLPPSGQLEQSF
jgi:hypothetical protein